MKRLYPLAAALCLLLLWGCPKEVKEDPVLTPNQIAYTIGADGGDVTISFKTNQECSVSSDASWLKESTRATKVVSTKNVTLHADANTSKDSRTANVTVTGGKLTITVTVTQDGKKDDTPTPPDPPAPEDPDLLENTGASTYSIPFSGGSFVVKVRSNVNYTYEVGADWITQTKAKTTREDNINFNVAANTGSARTAVITFSFDELSFTVTVSQAAYVEVGDDPYMELSTTDLFAEGEGGDYSIGVDANYGYEVVIGVSWISVVQTGETCILHIEPNPGEDPRTTRILFSCEDVEEFVTVNQVGMDAGADPFDIGSNLSARGTANCYIVTKAGDYTFDATVMGNGPEGFIWEDEEALAQFLWPWEKTDVSFTNYGEVDGPSQSRVLWDDGGVVTDVDINKLKVSFTATGNKGSALIAVYDRSNKLLWSWHIWCTDSPKRIKHETINGTPIVMLDRNLGATSVVPEAGSATYGYWYQFGRKDPLKLYYGVAGDMFVGQQSMEHSVLHPTLIYRLYGKTVEWFNGDVSTITADLWGNPYALHNGADHLYPATMGELRKTIYDPCPPGYMVPPEWAWDSFSLDDCTIGEYGLTFSEDNGDSFYPFAGFGDSGDAYGGDNGWYGYPGYTPNKAPDGKYHHNCRNVVACWSSGSAYHFDPQYNSENYEHVNMFFYLQDEEASQNIVMVNENSQKHLYPKFSHIRERCCSVRCMKMQ